ncbi:DNA-directed DNA polymerase [Handroanthus impetiginosus]|uniref:DNA-directed DNA polymerase n=1 Tax=Handroanthus impetiginosus TaxID=429701 RepID=A0A2G9HJX4_9LAMI|nr:DNA-directed DNA polymerase [Handroanthus impetiginosus]
MEVVKKEILKLLDAGVIYSISESRILYVGSLSKLVYLTTTFQGYVASIFSDHVENIIEVFMCDFTIYEKCLFMIDQGIILGHIVFGQGIEVEKAKIEMIKTLPYLVSVQKIRYFLGHDFLFEIMCDASNYGAGAILGQRIRKSPHVIYYASRTRYSAQNNYSTMEELLAIIFTLEKFCSCLLGTKVIIYSDHIALKHLLSNS